jgi:excisionase family DNA binding protein
MTEEFECQTLSIEDAGKVLGIGRSSAYKAVKSGEIPSLRFGSKVVVPRKALDALLQSAHTKQETE